MYKTTSAIVAATSVVAALAMLLTGFVMLPGFTPKAEADTALPIVNAAAKGDRLDLKTFGPNCAQKSWPYYESGCLRNTRSPDREPRKVRVIATR
jgi:hypothetical protein